MAINERLIHTAAEAAAGTGNQEEGLILHLDANDVDSYDGDGSVWYDITNHEYTPAVDPVENFNTVTWTGDGTTGRGITGVGFEPGLVWIKKRTNDTKSHRVFDSVRGANKVLYTNNNLIQASPTNELTAFGSDGFTIGNASAVNDSSSGDTYVAWCFKAGGAPTVSNPYMVDGEGYATASAAGMGDDGDLDLKKASVNTKLGFGIYNIDPSVAANETNSFTHGLGAPPELIISKNTGLTTGWWSWTNQIDGSWDYLRIDSTNGKTNDTFTSGAVADATTIRVNRAFYSTSTDAVLYAFASKRGISKVGSYTGGSTNEIYTGFEPAWLMVKRTNANGDDWHIFDNVRGGGNNFNKFLKANTNEVEGTASNREITFTASGFKWTNNTSNAVNTSSNNYIYLAFAAEKPNSLTPSKADFTEGTVTSGAELELDANDYSGTGNWLNTGDSDGDGVISGATYTNNGTSDYFNFDGSNDYVSIEDSTDNDYGLPSHTGTIEAWINIDSLSTENPIVNKRDTGNPGNRHFIFTVPTDGNVDFIAYNSNTNSQTVTSSTSLSTGKWHHVAVTLNTSNITIYIDGELDAQASATYSTLQNGGADLDIGRRGKNSGHHYFDGKIAQVRIYDTQLTSSEIKANYDATKGLYQYPDLKLHLDAGNTDSYDPSSDGSTWSDLTTGSNDATLTSMNANQHDKEIGGWFTFDGSADYGEISDVGVDTDTVSLELWARPHNITTQYTYIAMLGSAAATAGKVVSVSMNYGKLYSYDGNNFPTTGTVLTANKWHHIVVTRSGTSRKIYVNGQNVQTDTTATAYSGDDSLDIGRYGYSSGSNYFDGDIGQFRIYSSELSADQVMQNYRFTKNDYPNGNNFTKSGDPSWNSSGYWDFDGSGDQFYSSSSFMNNVKSFTITCWVNFDTISQNYIGIFEKRTGGTNKGFFLDCELSTAKKLRWSLYNSSNTFKHVDATTVMTTDTWYHVAVSYDEVADEMKIYQGTESTTTALEGTTTSVGGYSIATTGNFEIGGDGVSVNYLDGFISDVKVFDKVLSLTEIQADHAKGKYGDN